MATREDVQIARDLYSELRGITAELKGQESEISKSRKAFRAFEDVAQKFKLNQEDISKLNDKELGDLSKKLNTQLAIASSEAERLVFNTEIGTLLTAEVELLKAQGASQDAINDLVYQNLSVQKDLTDEQKALISAYFDEYRVVEDINNELETELAIREKANNLLGVSGNILKGLKALGPFSQAFKLDQVAEDMAEAADEAARLNKSFGKTRVLITGIKSAGKGLVETISDPAVIVGALVKGFTAVDKANVEFQRSTGESLNTVESSMAAAGSQFVTLSDYIKTASELTKELGQNAAGMFSPEDIVEASEMTEAMGMASKEAANLARLSKINGGNIKAQNEAIVAGVNSANKQNKTAVATGDILKAVANTSEGIAISYAGYPGELAKAATAAQALGMTLGDVDRIAGSLLNFEQSIQSEMEAELLTGRQLNLEKARLLALNNDLEGVAKELSSQGITSANFSKLNRVQQEAQAKALGMSRDEMAKMLLQQELSKDLSEDSLNAAQKQTLEQLKTQEATESFQKALEGVSQAFSPIFNFIKGITDSKAGMFALQSLIVGIVAAKSVMGMAKLAKSFTSVKDSVTEIAKDAGGGKGKALIKRLTGDTDKAAEATKSASAGGAKQGKGVKGFLKGLGDGLASIGKQAGNVIKGGLALGVVGAILGGTFAVAMMLVKDVDPVQMIAFSGALAIFGATAALIGKIGSQVMQGAAALLVMGLALVPAAFAFSLLEGLDTDALIAFSIALPLLSLAAAGLGFIAPFILAGSVAIGALGLALIPLAYGFSQMEGADSVGIVTSLATFAGLAPGLAAVAGSLFAVAGGLGAMAVAGLAALPVMAGLAGLGTVATGIAGVLGLGDEGGEGEAAPANNDTAILAQKLDQMNSTLQAILAKEGTVTLDGTKVGTALTVANSKLQ